LLAASPHYPAGWRPVSVLAHLVNKRWDVELGKALKGAGFKL
jgi:hypothetical protein